MPRGRSSRSSLARPESPIYELASKIQEYIHLPDPTPLYVTLGSLVGNMIEGYPVWLMMVGASGCGKTLMIEMLANTPKTHLIGVVKGQGSLLSATGKKERSRSATGGVLREVGQSGVMLIKDFTTILSLSRDPLMETIAAFREIHDGRFTRSVGAEGGRSLRWTGRIGLIGGATPAIDNHSRVIGELGERWIYYRFPTGQGYSKSMKVLQVEDREDVREELRGWVNNFLEHEGLTKWKGVKKPGLTLGERNKIVGMATMAACMRSPVSRDFRTREVDDVATTEEPTRLSESLGQLYAGLTVLGLNKKDKWTALSKVAVDSVPMLRSMVVLHVAGSKNIVPYKQLKDVTRCSLKTVQRVVEDLAIHGVLREVKATEVKGRRGGVALTRFAAKELERGWGMKVSKEVVV